MLERLKAVNPWGWVFLALAAVLVYGTELIVKHILKVEPAKAYPHRIAIKVVGLALGVVGLLIIMNII